MKRGSAPARRLMLRRILADHDAGSQEELVRLLARRGYRVTQTTVSRDLAAIGAQKAIGGDGSERYTVQPTRGGRRRRELRRILGEFVLAVEHSRNLVVLKTPPGAASPVAAAIDRTGMQEVLGTVAGDDTVLVIARDATGGSTVARRLTRVLEEG